MNLYRSPAKKNHLLNKCLLKHILNLDLPGLEPSEPYDIQWYKTEYSYHNAASEK